MTDSKETVNGHHDIIIIGAGLSGINAAYRVQQGVPDLSYTILEARDVIGGTWSFFKYPGFRSDSEIANFAFSWAPWNTDATIADGPSILRYLEDTALKHGIDKNIQFNTKVIHADWRSDSQRWHLITRINDTSTETLTARFLIMSTGYYDYSTPMQAPIADMDKFTGLKIHPQFWPSDIDYKDKNIVIIGSGATTTTLVPALAKTAKHVTMIQRSPSYYLVMPTTESIDVFTRRHLPASLAYALIRMRVLILTFLFVQFCWHMPKTSAKLLRKIAKDELPPNYPLDPNFQPRYNPFEQRLCVAPDGDFFKAIREDKASVETDEVASISGRDITLKSSRKKLEDVDVLITATGLKLHIIGGVELSIDGGKIDVANTFAWRNTCLSDVPNLCFIFGYIDNAWTLGSDCSARLFVRMIRRAVEEGYSSFVPRLSEREMTKDGAGIVSVPLVPITSTYIVSEMGRLPKAATTAPWKPRWHYFWDYWFAGWGSLEKGMLWVRVDGVKTEKHL